MMVTMVTKMMIMVVMLVVMLVVMVVELAMEMMVVMVVSLVMVVGKLAMIAGRYYNHLMVVVGQLELRSPISLPMCRF
jgi:hypothetical protein